jgi:hypothetical protein
MYYFVCIRGLKISGPRVTLTLSNQFPGRRVVNEDNWFKLGGNLLEMIGKHKN